MKVFKKYKITISILFLIVLFFIVFIYERSLSPMSSFKKKSERLSELVKEIKLNGKVKELSIDERKRINSLNEKYFSYSEKDSLAIYLNHKVYFIDVLLKEENIDKKYFERIKSNLQDLDFNSFFISTDNVIVFPISQGRYGFIFDEGNSWIYNEPIYHRSKLAENWYYWSF